MLGSRRTDASETEKLEENSVFTSHFFFLRAELRSGKKTNQRNDKLIFFFDLSKYLRESF